MLLPIHQTLLMEKAFRGIFLLDTIAEEEALMVRQNLEWSQELMRSLFPEHILHSLLVSGAAEDNGGTPLGLPTLAFVEHYDQSVFLYLDIAGTRDQAQMILNKGVDSTMLAAYLPPQAMIRILNLLFLQFDLICLNYGLEKVHAGPTCALTDAL